MRRYYYKAKNGKGFINLKSPLLKDKLDDYEEITEEQFNVEIAKTSLTAEQIHKNEIYDEIQSLKSQLAATDYLAIKYAEGWISEEDYAPIKAQRQALRDQINQLEAE